MSRELVLRMSISVDGFVADENGGNDWVFRTSSPESRTWLIELMAGAGIQAVGRKSFEHWTTFWPTSTLPQARAMNEIPKAVFSRSGKIATPNLRAAEEAGIDEAIVETWRNPIVGGADLAADIQHLKEQDGGPILAHGGASFASSLIKANLIDRYLLVVHPIALGRGLPIFTDLEKPLDLKLEELRQFDTGVVIKTYRPA